MTRDELQRYIFDHYSTEPDYPWADAPNNAVFRHTGNRKWFALILDGAVKSYAQIGLQALAE